MSDNNIIILHDTTVKPLLNEQFNKTLHNGLFYGSMTFSKKKKTFLFNELVL